MTHTLLPAPRLNGEVERMLSAFTQERMLEPARSAGHALQLVGATVLPQGQTIARTRWGTWLFVDHVEDPTAAEYGGKIPIPEAEHTKLTALSAAGVRPDLVWCAHQLPDDWQEGEPFPQLVPAPAHLREKDQRLIQRFDTASNLILRGAKGVGMTLAVAAAAPLAIVGAAGAGLDPIVLGGVKHPELPVVQWCVLAQWQWE